MKSVSAWPLTKWFLITLAAGLAVTAHAGLPVTNGLVCWFDAAAGVSTDSNGVVQAWSDLSGNGHFGWRSAGTPVLAANQVNSMPAIQFRGGPVGCGFNLDGPLFVGELYVVARSPNEKWNNDGCFLGRRWGRGSSHRLSRGTSAFWGDQWPEAVTRNGRKLSHPFDLAPINEYMIVKIDVNDGNIAANTCQIGMGDGASCDMDIAEIIGYEAALSPSGEAMVGGYLAAKYGISTTYPAVTNAVRVEAGAGSGGAGSPAIQAAAGSRAAVLLVTNGLACWFDAAVGVTANEHGEIQAWNDRSGNGHNAAPGGGAPVLGPNRIASKPAVEFRGNWLGLAGTFFAREAYFVVRSPVPRWSGAGSFLGRLKGRGSSFNTWGGDSGFWQDQHPAAVSRNGAVLQGPSFDCSPLTNFMILKIAVNDGSTNEAAYAIGNNDGLHACDFDVAEILGYDTVLSPPQEEMVGGYLAAKYGLATAYPPLPPAEPQKPAPSEMAGVRYKGWLHSGSMFLLTTPEGADLPATAREDDFPVLVRLDRDWFNFAEAKPDGEDIRFATADGIALAYQVDEWNAAAGRASVWVRVPAVRGNTRQELRMYWGRADAASESSGAAVFNKANRYLGVWHMNEPVSDETGMLGSKDAGTTPIAGPIGMARHFPAGRGIDCGDRITSYPFASSPHTSEAWFRAEKMNSTILSWGNRDGVDLKLSCTPGRILVESGSRRIEAVSPVPKAEWVHVVYTYDGRSGRVYLNGRPDVPGPVLSTMQVQKPVRMRVGPGFAGDIDEVRVSGVARSAAWVKLQYENQKPMQTLVGPLVQPGSAFSVSQGSVDIGEGKSVAITARAGGAWKVYWVEVKDGNETVVAADRFSYTFNAGRVRADTKYILRFKAVYADGTKTKDIPVTVRETIPEPEFTLKTPAKWNGRDPIKVAPEIRNLAAMKAKGAGELRYSWEVSGGAVMKEIGPEGLVLKRSLYTGPITVKVAVNNGGADRSASRVINVSEPKSDPWTRRIPETDEQPEDGQFYARDDRNEGTLFYNGSLSNAADSVFLRLYADGKLIGTERQKPAAQNAYAFTVKLKAGLVQYKVEFGTQAGGVETVLRTVTNLVCGDAFLIDGQSNALATDTGEQSPPETSCWIRSYGGLSGRGDATGWVRDRFSGGRRENLWCSPVWKAQRGEKAELGWWGMELAKGLVARHKVPVFMINAAVGGTRIDEHKRCETNHASLATMYGRMLWRVENARLTHGIRAILWHQGEADQGSDGPDGGYGWETYQNYFVDMSLAWKQDFPNLQHIYVFQIWPNGCGQGGGHGDMLREKQRTLTRLFSNLDVMPTLGIRPPGPCHYPLAGWTEFAFYMQPLIERDFYGVGPALSITAPNLKRAYYAGSAGKAIALEFDQPVAWKEALADQFYLDGVGGRVASGSVSGNVLTLQLKEGPAAKTITYLNELNWSQDKLLWGANGIAALTFCEVGIDAGTK